MATVDIQCVDFFMFIKLKTVTRTYIYKVVSSKRILKSINFGLPIPLNYILISHRHVGCSLFQHSNETRQLYVLHYLKKKKKFSSSGSSAIQDTVTYRCVKYSGAFPRPWLRRSSCCTVETGRCLGSGGYRYHSPPRPSLVLSVAHCSSTSDGPVGSSRSETRSHKPCRERCPLEGRGRGQRGHDIRIYEVLSYLCPSIKIKSLHICIHAHTHIYTHFHSPESQKHALKGFSTKSSAAAYRCVATTGLVPFLKGKQEHWTICLQKPPCRAEPR